MEATVQLGVHRMLSKAEMSPNSYSDVQIGNALKLNLHSPGVPVRRL